MWIFAGRLRISARTSSAALRACAGSASENLAGTWEKARVRVPKGTMLEGKMHRLRKPLVVVGVLGALYPREEIRVKACRVRIFEPARRYLIAGCSRWALGIWRRERYK
jgi:hypothetical protein